MGVASLSIFFSKAVERDRKTQEFLSVELRFKHLNHFSTHFVLPSTVSIQSDVNLTNRILADELIPLGKIPLILQNSSCYFFSPKLPLNIFCCNKLLNLVCGL